MKRILTILALVAFTLPSGVATQQASAQIDKSPWYNQPTNPDLGAPAHPITSGAIPSGSVNHQYSGVPKYEYSADKQPTAPAMKPVALPPVEFDREYKGQLVVTKFNDYSLIRMICKDVPTAIACSYRTYKIATGAPISCLIMLGPAAHDDERALRHEIGHCNGWSEKHEGAR